MASKQSYDRAHAFFCKHNVDQILGRDDYRKLLGALAEEFERDEGIEARVTKKEALSEDEQGRIDHGVFW